MLHPDPTFITPADERAEIWRDCHEADERSAAQQELDALREALEAADQRAKALSDHAQDVLSSAGYARDADGGGIGSGLCSDEHRQALTDMLGDVRLALRNFRHLSEAIHTAEAERGLYG